MVRLVSVCASLSEEELALLESLAHPTRFASGETLFTQGREAQAVYNVTAGVVRLYKLLSDGRQKSGYERRHHAVRIRDRGT